MALVFFLKKAAFECELHPSHQLFFCSATSFQSPLDLLLRLCFQGLSQPDAIDPPSSGSYCKQGNAPRRKAYSPGSSEMYIFNETMSQRMNKASTRRMRRACLWIKKKTTTTRMMVSSPIRLACAIPTRPFKVWNHPWIPMMHNSPCLSFPPLS